MTIVLKQRDGLGNIHHLYRYADGRVALGGNGGIALSLSYAFGEASVEAQMAIEEATTPDDVMRAAGRYSRYQWTVEPSKHDPAEVTVPRTSTVRHVDHSGNVSYVRRTESGKVYLVGSSGIALSLSNICHGDANAMANALSVCSSSGEMVEVLTRWRAQGKGLTPFPDRPQGPRRASRETREALEVIRGLLADPDNTEAAEELLRGYGMEADHGPTPRKPGPR